jgi:tetratricopeptide (TPR) repeat protein
MHFQRAAALKPSYALAHFQLGRVSARTGKYQEAVSELEKAVNLQPDLSEAYYQLGQMWRKLGDKEKSERALAMFKRYRDAEFDERKEILNQMRESIRGKF